MNKILLKGKVVETPSHRKTSTEADVCNFTLAVRSAERTEMLKIYAYKKSAVIALSLTKDDTVFIEAFFHSREILSAAEKSKGIQARRFTEIVAQEIHLLERISTGSNGPPRDSFSHEPVNSKIAVDLQSVFPTFV